MPESMSLFEPPSGSSGLLRSRIFGKTVLPVALGELNPSSAALSFEMDQGASAVVLKPRWAFQWLVEFTCPVLFLHLQKM